MVHRLSKPGDAGRCAGVRTLAGKPGGGSVSQDCNFPMRSLDEPTPVRIRIRIRITHNLACSSSLRFKLMAIIRQVKFSMRSWFGNCVFVLLYSFHICVAKGSFLCISSGCSRSALEASSFQFGKNASRSNSLRAILGSVWGSSLSPVFPCVVVVVLVGNCR